MRINKLTNLPESIGNLQSLKEMDLRNNQLVNIPDSFIQLNSLEYLDIRNNESINLPEKLGNMKSLKTIRAPKKIFGKNKDLLKKRYKPKGDYIMAYCFTLIPLIIWSSLFVAYLITFNQVILVTLITFIVAGLIFFFFGIYWLYILNKDIEGMM